MPSPLDREDRRAISAARPVFALVFTVAIFLGCTAGPEGPAGEPRGGDGLPAHAPTDRRAAQNSSAAIVAGRIAFRDVADAWGLRYTWPEQPKPLTALQAFGAGCAVFDADQDGWQDVLLVCGPHPRLFRNRDGERFDDATESAGLAAVGGNWMGCAVGDYDGDGLPDLLLTGYHCLALYRNLGGFRFAVATDRAGLDPQNQGEWGSSAGFIDLDGDQWLDLVILNYVVFGPDSPQYCEHHGVRSGCNPRMTYPAERGRIWRNSDSGRFEAVPSAQGMDDTHGMGLVLAFSDLDEDGRIDFYIGNDGLPADLLHNLGEMRFENVAPRAGVAQVENGAVAAMGADWADFDRDGLSDLIVTNWQRAGAVLFRGAGDLLFADQSQRAGVTRCTKSRMGFGAKWVDFENDGWPDIFLVNGHVYDNSAEVEGPGAPFRQPISLLSSGGGTKFVDLTPTLGEDVKRAMVGRGSATGDFDNDGRMDLLAVDFEGPVMLLRNEAETGNHWLKLDLRGVAPNVFAYGALVTGKGGDRIWRSEVSPASSYLSSSDPRIHWGLGELTALDSITIRWASGVEQTLVHVPGDQVLRVTEQSGP